MKKLNLFREDEETIFTITKICELGDEERIENELPHLHDFYSILWIDSGEAVHATEFVEYVLQEGSILFVPPGLKHRLMLGGMAGGYSILFNEDFIRFNRKTHTPLKEYRLFNNPEFKSLIRVEEQARTKMAGIVEQMHTEVQRPDNYSPGIVSNLLELFLMESLRIFDRQYQAELNGEEENPVATVIRFKELIEANYQREKSVSNYADMLGMNPSCLNEISKKATGLTAGEMIRNRIIDEAKQKLFATDLSGKEIAYELGFDDPAYFSRFFKKYTGLTLKAFRNNSRKKYH